MTMTSAELIAWLGGLLNSSPPAQGGDEEWFLGNKRFLDRLHSGLKLDPTFFHFIHHYISDADIRRREPHYRASQDDRLREYIVAFQREQSGGDKRHDR